MITEYNYIDGNEIPLGYPMRVLKKGNIVKQIVKPYCPPMFGMEGMTKDIAYVRSYEVNRRGGLKLLKSERLLPKKSKLSNLVESKIIIGQLETDGYVVETMNVDGLLED